MVGTLEDLINNFNPRRSFSNRHTTIEVDGVFVRIPEEEIEPRDTSIREAWTIEPETKTVQIPLYDLLQDPSIIRSARVSTGRDLTEVSSKAQGMVKFLQRDHHDTPREGGIMFRLRVITPIAYAQPWFRLQASHNEFSGRYSELDTGYYIPENLSQEQKEVYETSIAASDKLYRDLLALGLAKEQARFDVPYCFNTKFYVTISLREIMKFLSLSNVHSRHAQTEFYLVKETLEEILSAWTPWAYDAYKEFPHTKDFSWVDSELEKHGEIVSWMNRFDVLDKGSLSLRNTYGSEELIWQCLSDFPDPEKAFGHAGMTFMIHLPIFVFRQWVRHRFGHWSELKPDFDATVMREEFYRPTKFKGQSGKPGHYIFNPMSEAENAQIVTMKEEDLQRTLVAYQTLRTSNVCEDLASGVLPYRFYIPVRWTVSLDGLFNFLSLRTDSHAQAEIQEYARIIWPQLQYHFPRSAKVFAKHLYFGDWAEIKNFAEQ